MTRAVYPVFKEGLISGIAEDLLSVTVKLVLIDSSLTVYDWRHTNLSQVNSAGFYKTSGALAGKTVTAIATGAQFDCNDITFAAVTGTGPVDGFFGYVDTGDPTTSRLIFYQNDSMSGAPITPDGSDIKITVDAAGLFIL